MTLCASCRLLVLEVDGARAARACGQCGHLLCFKCFGFRSIYHPKMDKIFHKPRAVCLGCHMKSVDDHLLRKTQELRTQIEQVGLDEKFKQLDQAREKVLNHSNRILGLEVLKDFATYVHQRKYLLDSDQQDRIWQGLFEDSMKGSKASSPHIFACDRYNLETQLQPEGAYSTSVSVTSDQLSEITHLIDQPKQLLSYLHRVTDHLADLYSQETVLLKHVNDLISQTPFYDNLLEQLETESRQAAHELLKHQSYICTVVKPSLCIERFKKLYHKVVMEMKNVHDCKVHKDIAPHNHII